MDITDYTFVRTVLILKTDRLCADTLRQYALRLFPLATVKIVASIHRAAGALTSEPIDLLVTGVEASADGDMLDFLSVCTSNTLRVERVLVVMTQCEDRVVAALRMLPIQGVFDSSTDPPEQLMAAMRLVATGNRYWSPSVMDRVQHHHLAPSSIFRRLTPTEQLVLSVVGDGCDDISASRQLGLSPATVTTVRRKLHRKLGVQHRGELVRIAAQNGFVRFTPEGVTRPGFSMLTAAYHARKTRHATDAA
jgi:DNA-binding NarL/FixJ family response regulator